MNTTPASETVTPHLQCLKCEYDLTGLSPTRECPECGKPIEESVAAHQLVDTDPAYVRRLHRGVFAVQTGLIVFLISAVASGVLGAATGGQIGAGTSLTGVIAELAGLLSLAGMLAAVFGWWALSQRHPDEDAGLAGGRGARLWIRGSLIAYATSYALTQIIAIMVDPTQISAAFMTALLIITLGNFFVLAAWFFASMRYLMWMAPRLPNAEVHRRAKRLRWVGPLLMTFGLLLFGLGPLFALVMYYNLLNMVRKELRRIRRAMSAEPAGA